jgi:DNA-binding CsgD family transcriptional regulator
MLFFKDPRSREKGLRLLEQSLDVALENNYEEKIGHAYAAIASSAVVVKDYALAKQMLEEGIQFCEDRDVDVGVAYLEIYRARLLFETGNWNEAYDLAKSFLVEDQFSIIKIGPHIIANTIKMRRGDAADVVRLMEAKQRAFETQELHRILPALSAMLEYEWLTGERVIEKGELDYAIAAVEQGGNIYENSAFAFWLMKARNQSVHVPNCYEGYVLNDPAAALKAAALWKEIGCPYEQALALFEGDVENKKEAISLMKKIGADAVYNKMKQEMRNEGITNIPRGIRKNTRSNPAHLTERELDILHLMKEGMQNKEIGNKLFIASKTVDNHITSIFYKLNVHSRTRAVEQAIQMQILK